MAKAKSTKPRVAPAEIRQERTRDEHDPTVRMSKELGALLRRARERIALSRQRLVERCKALGVNISEDTIVNYENGRTAPSVPVVYTLAEAMGADPKEFLRRKPGPKQPGRHRPFGLISEISEVVANLPENDVIMVLNYAQKLGNGRTRATASPQRKAA
ncbi:MAG: helix-turn-helix transcriptional regulator [Alphaproteobacteria bacterium]|nr:helix-turn-helix transcriptional regulator [Alphaproteobacteria bacterium]